MHGIGDVQSVVQCSSQRSLTGGESTVAQTTHHIADNLGGAVAFLQRQPAEHIDGKEQNDEVGAEPRGKERRIELDDGGCLADVDGKFGGVVLQIGHDGWLRVAGAPQVEKLEAVCGAHPGGGHQERNAHAEVHLRVSYIGQSTAILSCNTTYLKANNFNTCL